MRGPECTGPSPGPARSPLGDVFPAGEWADLDLPPGRRLRVAHGAEVRERLQLRHEVRVGQRMEWRLVEVRHRPEANRVVFAGGRDPFQVRRNDGARSPLVADEEMRL